MFLFPFLFSDFLLQEYEIYDVYNCWSLKWNTPSLYVFNLFTRDFSQIVVASQALSEEFVITVWDKIRGLYVLN